MKRRLPADAFEHYFSLGIDRSYEAVAKHFGVHIATVKRHAKKDDWPERLRERERQARELADQKAREQMDQVIERHLKGARILQSKALEALRSQSPDQALRAATALNIAWKHELLILGEPTDRQAQTIEEVTRREVHNLLERIPAKDPVEGEQDDDGEDW